MFPETYEAARHDEIFYAEYTNSESELLSNKRKRVNLKLDYNSQFEKIKSGVENGLQGTTNSLEVAKNVTDVNGV